MASKGHREGREGTIHVVVVDKDSGMRISPGPLREGLGKAYVVGLGGVRYSEDEREGP